MQAAAQEAEKTEKPEHNRKLRDLQTRWAEASEQRVFYADKALQIRNLTDRIRVMEEGLITECSEDDKRIYKNGKRQKEIVVSGKTRKIDLLFYR